MMSFLSPVGLLFNGCRRLNRLTLSSHLCMYVRVATVLFQEKRKWHMARHPRDSKKHARVAGASHPLPQTN